MGCRLAILSAYRLVMPSRLGYSPGGAVTSTTPAALAYSVKVHVGAIHKQMGARPFTP